MKEVELVIKIPKEQYNDIIEHYNTFPNEWKKWGLEAIRKGIPLPKGHGRLIDADYLREDFKASKRISFAERMDISCIVDHAPTIIEADRSDGV
jgi:hypothetical protein